MAMTVSLLKKKLFSFTWVVEYKNLLFSNDEARKIIAQSDNFNIEFETFKVFNRFVKLC